MSRIRPARTLLLAIAFALGAACGLASHVQDAHALTIPADIGDKGVVYDGIGTVVAGKTQITGSYTDGTVVQIGAMGSASLFVHCEFSTATSFTVKTSGQYTGDAAFGYVGLPILDNNTNLAIEQTFALTDTDVSAGKVDRKLELGVGRFTGNVKVSVKANAGGLAAGDIVKVALVAGK